MHKEPYVRDLDVKMMVLFERVLCLRPPESSHHCHSGHMSVLVSMKVSMQTKLLMDKQPHV